MLHRHGLAPLFASGTTHPFQSCLKHAKQAGQNMDLQDFIECEEGLSNVMELQALFRQLSLEALRNLHSFDHIWSRNTWHGKVTGCEKKGVEGGQDKFGGCFLQAGQSQSVHDFMEANGFEGETLQTALTELDWGKIDHDINSNAHGLDRPTADNWATPRHTGVLNIDVNVSEDKTALTGEINWGDGGHTTVDLPISEGEAEKWRQMNDAEHATFLLKRREAIMQEHNAFMQRNRLKFWASEDASFFKMCESLQAYARTHGGGMPHADPDMYIAAIKLAVLVLLVAEVFLLVVWLQRRLWP
eukprot:TRINITY_DN30472_c0_g1_i2.p1 TRINITY_DN30472_c0_g1~~TRINITY_DN30472_c0_g1_i2.p1  ORF type:complete len:301 (-),score=52.75 TRINITY_DN30472_c0_g1_i2:84-986(-)